VLIVSIIPAQQQVQFPAQKLDLQFARLLSPALGKVVAPAPGTEELPADVQPDGTVRYHAIVYTSDPDQLRAHGIHPNSVLPGFVTARLSINDLRALAAIDAVRYVKPSPMLHLDNDVASGLIGATLLHSGYVNGTVFKGANVLVGVIDTGIDWTHLDFRDPTDTTKSRIIAIWDQTLTATDKEASPAGFSLGVEYTQNQINDELDGDHGGFVRERDTHGHGTHVTGTAAGNGASLASRKYAGIAPEADIIVVKAGNGSFPTDNIIDGLSYLNQKATALGKPVVVNMSLGTDYGPHDGTDALNAAAENFAGRGRVPVMAAGNSGGSAIHIQGTVPASDLAEITFAVPSYTPASGAGNDAFALDLWLDDGTSVNALATSPNDLTAAQDANGSGTTTTDDGAVNFSNLIGTENGDREIYMRVYDSDANKPPAPGTWTLRLANATASAVGFHGWLYDNSIGSPASEVTIGGGNSDYTVHNTAADAIIVGSYIHRWRWYTDGGSGYYYGLPDRSDDISSFSSIGPTRTGLQKPDIAAPGQGMASSRSADATVDSAYILPGGKHFLTQGTSMASPVTAGAAALLLGLDSTFTASGIKGFITSTADADDYTRSEFPEVHWGYGKLDVARAMIKALNGSFSAERHMLVYDQWGTSAYYNVNPNDKIAVRFSPTAGDTVTGAFIHFYTTMGLTSPLSLEVWSDSAEVPNAKVGSTVTVDTSKLLRCSWNFIDMTPAHAAIDSGSQYHLVVYFTSGTATQVLCDVGSVDARSSVNTGSGWSAFTSGDFRLRVETMTDLTGLPVQLASLTATAGGQDVFLSWLTATEVDNYGFEVERRQLSNLQSAISNLQWFKVGFVAGNGTCSTPHTYQFADRGLEPGRYAYRLKQMNTDGSFTYSFAAEVTVGPPIVFALDQNFPNPFNSTTTIRYALPEPSHVKITVFDVLGRTVAVLVDEGQGAGNQQLRWDATVSSGVYLYRIDATGLAAPGRRFTELRKMVVVK
jgi:minor extracellular serine protease Vpr